MAVVQAYILRILEEAGPGMKVRLVYIAAIPCTVSSSVADPDPYRICLGLPDPDPVVRGTDPDLSIIEQK